MIDGNNENNGADSEILPVCLIESNTYKSSRKVGILYSMHINERGKVRDYRRFRWNCAEMPPLQIPAKRVESVPSQITSAGV